MFCSKCGKEVADNVNFCANCGAKTPGIQTCRTKEMDDGKPLFILRPHFIGWVTILSVLPF